MTTSTPEPPRAAAPVPGTATAAVQTLLSAVRRRLWLGQFAAAVRAAAWASAAVMLLAAGVHGAVHAVPVGAVLAAVGLLWVAWLARAAGRRPADRACALWADRHLGGASAFTTWLDTGHGTPGRARSPAVRRLEAWATARVPASLRQVEARRDPAGLARPLLSMTVCGAVAGLVLTLPGLSPTAPQPAAAPAAASASAAVPPVALRLADAPAPAALAGEIAAALRATPARDADTPEGGRASAAAGPARADDGKPPATAQAALAPAGARAPDKPAPAGAAATAAAPGAASAQAPGAPGGREAGDSADARAEPGVSHALRGTMATQGVVLAATRSSGTRRADSDQAASFESDESQTGRRGEAARGQPAAATPPPATESMRLTPTETSYVQAWMKASPRRP